MRVLFILRLKAELGRLRCVTRTCDDVQSAQLRDAVELQPDTHGSLVIWFTPVFSVSPRLWPLCAPDHQLS